MEQDTVYNKFDTLLSYISTEHISICACQKDKIRDRFNSKLKEIEKRIKRAKRQKVEEEELEILRNSLLRKAREDTVAEISVECISNEIRCPVERDAIKTTIELFNNKYDLIDPRVYMVVKSVINHQLSAHRMQYYSTSYGLMQEHTDRDGNVSYKLNPVEEEKRKFDDSIIKAMEILSRMIDGETHNHTGVIAVVSADELFGEDSTDYGTKEVRELK